jgi:hypothetical protein
VVFAECQVTYLFNYKVIRLKNNIYTSDYVKTMKKKIYCAVKFICSSGNVGMGEGTGGHATGGEKHIRTVHDGGIVREGGRFWGGRARLRHMGAGIGMGERAKGRKPEAPPGH